MAQDKVEYIYAIRDKTTGKLRSDINNSHRVKKYWDRKSAAEKAIENYANYNYCGHCLNSADIAEKIKQNLEVVVFKLVEVESYQA